MRSIDIVHVITDLRTGGAETMLAKLIEVMDRDQFRQTVIALQDMGALGRRIEEAGALVITLNMKSPLDLPRAILRLCSILKKQRPHLVQTWLYHADFLGTLAARCAGLSPVLWNVRCSNMNFRDYALTTRLICAALGRMSSVPRLVISNSHTGRKVHEQLGYRACEWRIVPNGFDTERFRPDLGRANAFRTSLGVAQDVPLIGLPARLDPMKDHDTFLEAARLLADDIPKVRFVLAGTGLTSGNAEFVARVRRWGLTDRVDLLGERSDMEVVMAGLDIVTLCSAYGEGFPNVLGEALSCGALCVATDVGDSALVLGPHGRIVPPRNPAELANAWRDLLGLTPNQRLAQTTAGRRYIIDNYSLPAIGRIYQDLYLSLAPAAQKAA
jgi:glycosyltransferase involved in cell wall biosynthesis